MLLYYGGFIANGGDRGAVVRSLLSGAEGHATQVARLLADELGWSGPVSVLKTNPASTFWASYLGPN
jgi:hypothetical protein